MKKIRYLIFFLAFFLSFGNFTLNTAAGGTTILNIALQDSRGEYISGANVTVNGGKVIPEIYNGFYSLKEMPYGEYSFTVEIEGYFTKEWKFNFTKENYTEDFWLVVLTQEIPPEKISFKTPQIFLAEGEKTFLNITYEPANTNLREVKWTSSSPDIAFVDLNGRVNANKEGVAEITAVSEKDGSVYARCEVLVKKRYKKQNALNPESVFIKTGYAPVNNKFINMGYTLNYAKVAPVALRVGNNGNITVCAEPEDSTAPISFFELNTSMELIKTVTIERELPLFGNFIRDGDGNFYVFFGKAVTESGKDARNIALVKYDKDGNRIKSLTVGAMEDVSYRGVRVPFDAGSCRMEIAGDILTVYFSREMFVSDDGLNHQSSYALLVDLNKFYRISRIDSLTLPYSSHSFDQFILPDGENFVFADHGDAGDKRGFVFSKLLTSAKELIEVTGFKFKGKNGDNPVFSKMGAMALTSDGYIFLGAAEKNNKLEDMWHNDSHNLFVQTISNDLSKLSEPVWITDYNDKLNENSVFPKMVEISGDGSLAYRYAVLWEKRSVLNDESGTFKGTYMCVINEKGSKIVNNTLIPSAVPLSRDDVLRYNPKTGRIVWAVAEENGITVNSLDPMNAFSENSTDKLTITVKTTSGEILTDCEITLPDNTVLKPIGNKFQADLPFGIYDVTIKANGYMPKKESLNFYYSNQETSIILYGASINIYLEDVNGEPIIKPATITINDGIQVPRVQENTAFYSLLDKPFGRYTVNIEIEGYKAKKWTADFTYENYTDKYWVIIMEKQEGF